MTKLNPEYAECDAFFEWAQYHPILKEYLFKIVNEGKRNAITGYRLKRIGLRSGVPDYCLPYPSGRFHSLWIEMKLPGMKPLKKRNNQSEWIEKLNKVGHYATYAYGAEDASRITMDYLANKI